MLKANREEQKKREMKNIYVNEKVKTKKAKKKEERRKDIGEVDLCLGDMELLPVLAKKHKRLLPLISLNVIPNLLQHVYFIPTHFLYSDLLLLNPLSIFSTQ